MQQKKLFFYLFFGKIGFFSGSQQIGVFVRACSSLSLISTHVITTILWECLGMHSPHSLPLPSNIACEHKLALSGVKIATTRMSFAFARLFKRHLKERRFWFNRSRQRRRKFSRRIQTQYCFLSPNPKDIDTERKSVAANCFCFFLRKLPVCCCLPDSITRKETSKIRI